jgi:hypothetical protein
LTPEKQADAFPSRSVGHMRQTSSSGSSKLNRRCHRSGDRLEKLLRPFGASWSTLPANLCDDELQLGVDQEDAPGK